MALRYGLAVIALSASAFAQTPNLVANGIVNGASFDGTQGVSQGSLVSLFGTSLASRLALADSLPLSTSMGDVTVTFNGLRAPLLAVIPGAGGGQDQINGQVPWNVLPAGADGGTASVVVTRGGVSSPPQNVQITRSAPGIFSVQFGVGYAIAINPDSTLAAPVGSIPGLPTHPAKIGDPNGLILLATGLGPVDPPVADGAASLDQLRRAITTPTVLVGGVPAQVTFAGLAPQFAGVNQINILVPANAPTGDSVPLQMQVGGVTTTDKVTIALQP